MTCACALKTLGLKKVQKREFETDLSGYLR